MKNNVLTLDLIDDAKNVSLEIPSNSKLIIHPISIAWRDDISERSDYRDLTIENISGEIEINADGYNVNLDDVGGPISVITYGDINSVLSDPISNKLISLDSYQGNIDLSIPKDSNVELKCSAENGKVVISDKVNQNSEKGNTKVLLHSEGGDYVNVSESKKASLKEPTHPELRDILIKIFIEDQGKNRMCTKCRKELIGMGYEDHINLQPDTHKAYLVHEKHQKQLIEILDKYGFPTKEMVGKDYALSAVQMVMMHMPEYMKKYEIEFKSECGEGLYNMMMKNK